MAQFQLRPVEATQWFSNGDHPGDDVWRLENGKKPKEPREGLVVRYFRHPGISGDQECPICKKDFNDHGFIDTPPVGHVVCPGDWIVTMPGGKIHPMHSDMFTAIYAPC